MLYIANITYLDIIRTASKLLEFLQNLLLIYNTVATKAITYLYQIKAFAIEYLEKTLTNYTFIRVSNIIFGDDLVNRKSIKGYLFTLFKKAINQ